jgi:branched-chain amino acid transport system permease protein
MVVLVVSIVVLVAFGLFLSFTKLGTAMRAISDNEDLAESSGIDADQVYVATWAPGLRLCDHHDAVGRV